jgi:hypothetical protein
MIETENIGRIKEEKIRKILTGECNPKIKSKNKDRNEAKAIIDSAI